MVVNMVTAIINPQKSGGNSKGNLWDNFIDNEKSLERVIYVSEKIKW